MVGNPSGRYIAFSVNDIAQFFHSTDPNRIEVYDSVSDVVVYDVENHQVAGTDGHHAPRNDARLVAGWQDAFLLLFTAAEGAAGLQRHPLQHLQHRFRPGRDGPHRQD